jgi:hypothetical protein
MGPSNEKGLFKLQFVITFDKKFIILFKKGEMIYELKS